MACMTFDLHFAETYWTGAGQRLFDVLIEGVLALDNYDIYAKVGHDTAIKVSVPQVQVTDGQLRIDFNSVKDQRQGFSDRYSDSGYVVES